MRLRALLGLLLIAACGSSDDGGSTTLPPGPQVARLILQPASATLEAGGQMPLTVTAYGEGNTVVSVPISFTSTNPAIATVSTTGLVTGVAPGGPVAITAAAAGFTAAAAITVVAPSPQAYRISLQPPSATLEVGGQMPLAAVVYDVNNVALPVPISFTSADPAIATVSAAGLVTGVAPGGPIVVRATGAGLTAITQVTVEVPRPPAYRISLQPPSATLEVGGQVPLSAVVYDVNNVALPVPISFTSADPAIATVSAAGLVIGVAPGGPVAITAAGGGLTAQTRVTVTPVAVARVRIQPDTLIVQRDSAAAFTVRLESGDGAELTGRTVTWRSLNSVIAVVAPSGLVTPINFGLARIEAAAEGVADTAVAIVPLPPSQTRLVRVVNRLRYAAEVLVNEASRAIVSGNGELDLAVSALEPARVGWAVIRPTGYSPSQSLGEAVSDTFPTIQAPQGTERFEITATLSTGRRFYDPVVTTAVTSVVLDFVPRFDAPRCPADWCLAPASDAPPRRFGLWRVDAASTMEVYGRNDASRTGPRLSVPIPAASVDSITGQWLHTVTASP